MATLFTHAAASGLLGSIFSKNPLSKKTLFLLVFCSIFPDIDVIGFNFNIAYEDFWGHRGFTHSILFAFIFAVFLGFIFYRNTINTRKWWGVIALCTLAMASHGVLDGMTDGGLGVAFFSPFDNGRYFFSWTPIRVSPIGVQGFFSHRAVHILISEVIYIIAPLGAIWIIQKIFHKIAHKH